MQTILHILAEAAAERTAAHKRVRSLDSLRRDAEALPHSGFRFEQALRKEDLAFICECKKASPSKGLIAPDFPYLQIAKDYESAGADCISVLTEPTQFLGDDRYLAEIAAAVRIPCLRKDFTVDPNKYPDVQKWLEKLSKESIHIVPIIDAGVKAEEGYDIYDEGMDMV